MISMIATVAIFCYFIAGWLCLRASSFKNVPEPFLANLLFAIQGELINKNVNEMYFS